MGAKSGNPTWVDYPSTSTPITAAALENIEEALDNSGGNFSPPMTGRWISLIPIAGAVTVEKDKLSLQGVRLIRSLTVSEISCYVTAPSTNATIRLVIYTIVNGVPSLLMVDSGTMDASTTGHKTAVLGASVDLPAGDYGVGAYVAGANASVAGREGSAANAPWGPGATTPRTDASQGDHDSWRIYNTPPTSDMSGASWGQEFGQWCSVPRVQVRVSY